MLPKVETLAGANLVLHAGDIGIDRGAGAWMLTEFVAWAKAVTIPIYATWGNHDFIGERLPRATWELLPPNVHIHVDELVTIDGVGHVWFSPWSNLFGNWAFMRTEEGLAERYAQIPDSTNIIVSHGPPKGILDENVGGISCGSSALLLRMAELPDLQMVVCGHIHEARGTVDWCFTADHGIIEIHNVCLVNEFYQPVHDPVIIVWP